MVQALEVVAESRYQLQKGGFSAAVLVLLPGMVLAKHGEGGCCDHTLSLCNGGHNHILTDGVPTSRTMVPAAGQHCSAHVTGGEERLLQLFDVALLLQERDCVGCSAAHLLSSQ